MKKNLLALLFIVNSLGAMETATGSEVMKKSQLIHPCVQIAQITSSSLLLKNFTPLIKRLFYKTHFTNVVINHAGTHIAFTIDNEVYIVAIDATSQISAKITHLTGISKIEWSFDDTHIAVSHDKEISIFDTQGNKVQELLPATSLFCWTSTNQLALIDNLILKKVTLKPTKTESIVAFSSFTTPISPDATLTATPQGKYLILAEATKLYTVRLEDNAVQSIENKQLGPIKGLIHEITANLDDTYLAFKMLNGNVISIFDLYRNEKIRDIKDVPPLASLNWTPDNTLVAISDHRYTSLYHIYNRLFLDPFDETQYIFDENAPSTDDTQVKLRKQNHLFESSGKSLSSFYGDQIELTHFGRFIIYNLASSVTIYDYTQERTVAHYLEHEVTHDEAFLLKQIFDNNGTQLRLSSQDFQTFKRLPEPLQNPLKQWVTK